MLANNSIKYLGAKYIVDHCGNLWDPLRISSSSPFAFGLLSLCEIYSIPIGGARVRVPYAADGSGSGYIKGFMDANYRPGSWYARGRAHLQPEFV
jgi:hypothetical protein